MSDPMAMSDGEMVGLIPGPRNAVERSIIFTLSCGTWCVVLISVCRCCASGKGCGCGCFSSMRQFFVEADVSEGMSAVVQQRMRELKMSMMQTFMKFIFLGLLPWNLDVLNSVARGTFFWNYTAQGEIVVMLLHLVCGVPFARPSLFPPKVLNLVFVVLWSLNTLTLAPLICCTAEGTIRTFIAAYVFVVILNIVKGLGSRRDFLLWTVCNIVFLACWTYTWSSIYRNIDTWWGTAVRGATWVLLVITLGMLSAVLEAGFRKLLTQELQLAEVNERHNAATALLRSIYDVVVELDSKGCVVGTSRDLGSLLLHADPTMAGVQLAGLILEEADRKTFQHRLEAPRPKAAGIAENMHVSMKDSLGNTLRMEMMWFACDKADGATHSIVGIREFSDQAQVVSFNGAGTGTLPRPADFFPAPRAEGQEDGAESSDSEDTSSLPQTQVEATGNVDDEAQAMAVIDLMADDHPIRHITRGFRTKVGHVSRNAPLSRIVKKPLRMVLWMQQSVSHAENAEPLPPDYKVTLKMPQGKIVALCRLVLKDVGESDLAVVDSDKVLVLFYGVRLVSHRAAAGNSQLQADLRGTPAKSSNASLAGTESL